LKQKFPAYHRLFFLFLLLFSLSVGAQDLDRKISVSAKNKPLSEVLSEISRKGNILFSYSPQQVPVDRKVDIKAKDETVKSILDKLFKPLNIRYFVSENQVILKAGDVPAEQKPSSVIEKRKFTLSGYVRDKSSGEVLIGANVYDRNTWQGTSTNGYGFFSLTLTEGSYNMVCSLLGYETKNQAIVLNDNLRLTFEMAEWSLTIKEVEVAANPDEDRMGQSDASTMRLSNSSLKQMPGFAGNMDVIKSLHSVPGISSFGDGSSFYYVRGGNHDQNLLMIDDAPIYNPSHLFGFFSALAPDAIKDVKAYKGDFPASYGGRLSSVIDIRARDGNMKHFGIYGNAGLFTSDLTFEGPIKKEKSSFIVSARKSNLEWMIKAIGQSNNVGIGFFDLNMKFNIRINENNRLFLTGFAGNDDLKTFSTGSNATFGLTWKNSTGTLRWNHIFNNKLFANTTICSSRYDYFLYISRQDNNYWTSAISNGTLKTDFSWFPDPSNTVRMGAELTRHYSNPGNIYVAGKLVEGNEIPQYQSLQFSMYLSNEQEIREKLVLNYGLRLTSWRDLGPTTVYIFDATHKMIYSTKVADRHIYKSFLNPEPRITVNYALFSSMALRMGYSRTVQYMNMLSNSTSPFTSLEVWVPAGPTIQPQKGDQVTLGFIQKIDGKGMTFSLESFYKKLKNQIEYKDHSNMLYNPLIEGELRFGQVTSYGIEALFRKSEGKLTGWIGYSYSKSMKKAEGVNGGNEYPAAYDRPHTFTLNFSYRTGRHWEYSANWIFLSGSAVSTPVAFYRYNGYTVPVYGEKHNDRLPEYHRLDVAVTYWFNKPGNRFQHSLVFSVYNLYGRNNPFSVNFNKIMDDNGKFYIPANLDGEYVVVPSMLSVVGAIPSLNYTFRY
jgi:hypothetical protein